MPEPTALHDAQYFPIRLAYLYDSSLNDTVDWAWDAYDHEGNFYYITARRGALLISREGELIHTSMFGDEYDSKWSLDGLWELAGPLKLFDRSLLDGGVACICGYTYERTQVPEFCGRCKRRVRGCRLVTLYAEAAGPDPGWRFVDEYGREGSLVWGREAVDMTAPAGGGMPAIEAQFVIGKRVGPETPEAILSRLVSSLKLELDFSALECATCMLVYTSDLKKCPACGAGERGPGDP